VYPSVRAFARENVFRNQRTVYNTCTRGPNDGPCAGTDRCSVFVIDCDGRHVKDTGFSFGFVAVARRFYPFVSIGILAPSPGTSGAYFRPLVLDRISSSPEGIKC